MRLSETLIQLQLFKIVFAFFLLVINEIKKGFSGEFGGVPRLGWMLRHAQDDRGHFTSSTERTSIAVSSGVDWVCVELVFRVLR